MIISTAIWKPQWYELDQSLEVGQTDNFWLITSCLPIKFAVGSAKGREVKIKILSIYNAEIGQILKIDTNGLYYKFYSTADAYLQIEAEETPGRFENGDKYGDYLTDSEFTVQIQLLNGNISLRSV